MMSKVLIQTAVGGVQMQVYGLGSAGVVGAGLPTRTARESVREQGKVAC